MFSLDGYGYKPLSLHEERVSLLALFCSNFYFFELYKIGADEDGNNDEERREKEKDEQEPKPTPIK